MNDNSSRGDDSSHLFYSINVKGDWTYLAQKNSIRSIQWLGYHENV